MHSYSTLIHPIVTEKASKQQEHGQYAFMVKKAATKIDVKHAIKDIYGVEVKEVKMMVVPSKSRMIRRGKLWKKRSVYKKALVTMKDGKTIDPNKIKIKEVKEAKETKKK